jgi:sulfide dehydrogenase cytochrome subunit
MLLKKVIYVAMFLSLVATGFAFADGDPTRGEELAVECSDCHGEDGMGDEEYPRIAGLDKDYLYEQLVKIKNGEGSEKAEMMLWFFEDLEEQDLADLAAYYASQEGG